VRAQETPYQAARQEYQRGLEALRQHQADVAIRAFERSYEIRPSPVVLYNLALAYREAGRIAEALEAFDRYLRDPVASAPPAPTSAVRTEADRLRARLATVTLRGLPANATVRLVGSTRRVDRDTFPLEAGDHTLEIIAENAVARYELRLAAGDVREVVVELRPASVSDVAPRATASSPASPTPRLEEATRGAVPTWVWVSGGVSVLSLAGAIALGVYGNGVRDAYLDECQRVPYPAHCASDQAHLDTLGPIMYALWSVAGVGAIAATIGIVASRSSRSNRPEPSANVRLTLGVMRANVEVSW
jgi:hypothetical protein